jgi:hypothetical protein
LVVSILRKSNWLSEKGSMFVKTERSRTFRYQGGHFISVKEAQHGLGIENDARHCGRRGISVRRYYGYRTGRRAGGHGRAGLAQLARPQSMENNSGPTPEVRRDNQAKRHGFQALAATACRASKGAPSILDKDYTITAEITIPDGGAEGMIATLGGRFGGYGLFLSRSNNWWLRSLPLKIVVWGLFVVGLLLTWFARNRRWSGWKTRPGYALLLLAPLWLVAGLLTGIAQIGRGRPVFVYNLLDLERFRWSGPALDAGKHTIVFDFKYDGPGPGKGGTGVLTVDGKDVDHKTLQHTIPLMMTIDETFDIGVDTRTPVDFSYDPPFRFNGTIDKLTYKLGPEQLTAEDKQKAAQVLARAKD